MKLYPVPTMLCDSCTTAAMVDVQAGHSPVRVYCEHNYASAVWEIELQCWRIISPISSAAFQGMAQREGTFLREVTTLLRNVLEKKHGLDGDADGN